MDKNRQCGSIFRIKIFFLIVIMGIGSTKGCGQSRPYDLMLKTLYKNTVPIISVSALKEQMTSGIAPIILDTREANEYNVSHIPNARYVGYDFFNLSEIKDIPKPQPIIVYCSVGYRSERIGEKLQSAGYTNVKNLYGGIFEWSNQGYPMKDKKNNPTYIVHGYAKEWGIWLKGKVVYP